jgi:hypothetical protein
MFSIGAIFKFSMLWELITPIHLVNNILSGLRIVKCLRRYKDRRSWSLLILTWNLLTIVSHLRVHRIFLHTWPRIWGAIHVHLRLRM